ncbi:hypothetical protein HDU83_002830 [Entophlyctis luteolus]|nr:hypothetical protein HDU83_002830 [Entophlyctis luteolus]
MTYIVVKYGREFISQNWKNACFFRSPSRKANAEKLVNPNCQSAVVLAHLKNTCGYSGLTCPVDLATEAGEVLDLNSKTKEVANKYVELRKTYILVKVMGEFGDDAVPMYYPLLDDSKIKCFVSDSSRGRRHVNIPRIGYFVQTPSRGRRAGGLWEDSRFLDYDDLDSFDRAVLAADDDPDFLVASESFLIDPFASICDAKGEASIDAPPSKFCWSSCAGRRQSIISPSATKSDHPLSQLCKLIDSRDLPAKDDTPQKLEPTQPTPTEPALSEQLPGKFRAFPREVVSHILSFVSNRDRKTCASVSKLWSEEAIRWLWRDQIMLCHGFLSDLSFDVLLDQRSLDSETQSLCSDCQSPESLFSSSGNSDCDLSWAIGTESFPTDGLNCSPRQSHSFYPYHSFIRSMSLEIALPSLDDNERCERLVSRLETLKAALMDAEKFLGVRKCDVVLSWVPRTMLRNLSENLEAGHFNSLVEAFVGFDDAPVVHNNNNNNTTTTATTKYVSVLKESLTGVLKWLTIRFCELNVSVSYAAA